MHKTFTLITGASGGFGAELARLCAEDGRNLILVARQGDKLAELAAELKRHVTVHVIVQDLAEHGAAQKVYKRIRNLRLTVDQLINNAGSGDFAPLIKANPTRQESMIALNITALTLLTNLLLPDMVKHRRGRILNVASVAAFVPLPQMSVYGASKAFVLSFSEALSAELRGSGVTVTCLCPGAAKTGFSRAARLSSTHPIASSRVTARSIAAFGYSAMMAGLPIAVPGLKNKLFIQLVTRLLPRAVTRTLMLRFEVQS